MNRFASVLTLHGQSLRRAPLHTLQLNIGRKCNQACRHCHVDAGPWRTEMMDAETFGRVAAWIGRHRPPVVDITGGAPELSEFFRPLVEVAHDAGCHVIDRNNLTIIEEPDFGWLPEYLAAHDVEVIASLPCYSAANVNQQRGQGVFEKSIRALQKLNAAGYGTRLPLNLVYNPLGPKLPGPQTELEADYKAELQATFGIVFHRLFTITNQPIARFAEDLRKQGRFDEYLELLATAFNPATVEGLMCRTTVSVGWRGELYDCDFNQMLGMGMKRSAKLDVRRANGEGRDAGRGLRTAEPETRNPEPGTQLFLWDVTPADLDGGEILTGVHCFACTAGCGSSCTGAIS